jgi:hypothetical protein
MNVGIRLGCNAEYDAVCFLPHRQNSPSQSQDLAEVPRLQRRTALDVQLVDHFFCVHNALDMGVGRKFLITTANRMRGGGRDDWILTDAWQAKARALSPVPSASSK